MYFTGTPAAPTFGPMLRFVAGTDFSALRIARHMTARARRHHSPVYSVDLR